VEGACRKKKKKGKKGIPLKFYKLRGGGKRKQKTRFLGNHQERGEIKTGEGLKKIPSIRLAERKVTGGKRNKKGEGDRRQSAWAKVGVKEGLLTVKRRDTGRKNLGGACVKLVTKGDHGEVCPDGILRGRAGLRGRETR